jgi:uncharacterized membrane protein
MRRTLARRRDQQDGAISIMAAVLVVALVMATSLAVDVGRVAFTSRDQQGVTDRVVLDAVRTLGENAPPGATYEELYDLAVAAATQTLNANEEGSSVGTARDRQISELELGYVADGVFRPVWTAAGPAACYATADANGYAATAVRVVTDSYVDFVFGFLDEEGGRPVTKESVGSIRLPDPNDAIDGVDCPEPEYTALAGLTVATRLVEFDTNRSTIFAPLLGDLLNTSGTLTLVGFDGLATANLTLLDLLGGTTASVGSVDQILDSQITVKELLDAAAAGLTTEDAAAHAAAITALGELSAYVDPALTFRIGDILYVDTENTDALLAAQANVLDWVMAAAMAARIATGDHLVELDLTGTDLLGLQGLLTMSLDLTLIEAPQSAFGPAVWLPAHDADGDGLIEPGEEARWQTTARTAQVSAGLRVGINRYYADTLLGPLASLIDGLLCLLGPALCGTQNVDLTVHAAQAEAGLAAIDCSAPISDSNVTTVARERGRVAVVRHPAPLPRCPVRTAHVDTRG